jgi:ornithine carbamoyltransferase
MSVRHLITLRDLQPGEFDRILDTALDMKKSLEAYRTRLAGQSLAMIFEKPSLRTRVSFEMAIVQLGGHPVHLPGADIGLGKRESIADMTRCLGRWCDAIMIRTFATTVLEEMARHSSVPIINGLTDEYHPCQALADYLTMRESKRELRGLTVAYVGDGNNVAHSLALGAGHCGANLRIITPPGFEPAKGIIESARAAARQTGGDVEVGTDIDAGVDGAAVVYTDVWASMGQESEAADRKRVFGPYQIDSRVMQMAAPGAIFMHCLPAHRGDEVTAEVADSDASVIFRQAENRMHAQRALLLLLMAGLD